ncbi:MAG: hypothetical protein AAF356_05335 [Planctomycetota bacterium]
MAARSRRLSTACVFGSLTCAASPALAQLQVSEMMYRIDGWDIVPVVGVAARVDSLLLFRVDVPPDPQTSVTAVFAQRTIDDAWQAEAWVGATSYEVAEWAAAELGVSDPTDPDSPWPVEGVVGFDSAPAGDPVPFVNGVIAGHWLEPIVPALDDPQPVVAIFEQAGEPVAASSVTLAGGVTPVGGVDPADPGGGNPCIALVTPEQIWTAVADSIESELVTPGTVHDVFDDTLDLAITCCWLRCFCHAPLPWGPRPNGCTPWDNWKDTPLANGCIGEASWRRDREELQWRHATWTSITCVKTTMWQSRTRTRRECTTTEWDTLGAAYCIDEPTRPNVKTAPPATFPGPFCSVPGNPFATSGWTPRCIPW